MRTLAVPLGGRKRVRVRSMTAGKTTSTDPSGPPPSGRRSRCFRPGTSWKVAGECCPSSTGRRRLAWASSVASCGSRYRGRRTPYSTSKDGYVNCPFIISAPSLYRVNQETKIWNDTSRFSEHAVNAKIL